MSTTAKTRVNTYLDKELVKRAKIRAVEVEKPLNELIEEALRKLLEAK